MPCSFKTSGGWTVSTWRTSGAELAGHTRSKLGQLLCDGCDKPLCAPCAVAPRGGVDYCPTCCRALFVEWANSPEGKRWSSGAAALKLPAESHRNLRRNAFRKYATENAERFETIRTTQSFAHGAAPYRAVREDEK